MTDQKIAVIICAYTEDRWEDLIDAVNSMQKQSRLPDQIVLVIDHSPTLFKRAQRHFPSLCVLENHNPRGLSGARNTGIAAADADWIAFLDDDAVADVNWLENLAEVLKEPDVLGVGGQILPQWEGKCPAWFPPEFYWVVGCSYRGLPTHSAEVRNLVGASMLIRRTVFDTVGGFRSEIGRVGTIPLGCEETELCIRAHQQIPESRFMYAPEALVYHKVPAKRAQWSYFRARCYAEGVSKALISQFIGAKDGLSAERTQAMTILPKGVLRGLADTLLKLDINGLARATAIVAGLFITALGYLSGGFRLRTIKPSSIQVGANSLRILLVSARYFPLAGGTETHVYEVARRFSAAGQDVTVLTTNPEGNLPCEEICDGVHVRRVRAWPRNRDYYFAPGIFRIITQGKWDVVHIQGYHTLVAPLAMFASWVARIPYVVTFHSGGHSSQFRNSGRSFQRMLLKPLLDRAAQLIGVSQFEADFFANSLGFDRARFVVIPNGSHLPTLSHPVQPSPYPLIVSSGRLERYKGHQRVIAALPKVLEKRADVRLRIVGLGPYENDLRNLADNLGVAEQVEISSIAPDNREGMAELFSRATLVTLFSEYEAHPVAIMEALSLKRSVLVTDTSGLRELAQRGLVRAIPLEASSDDVALAIIEQLDHPLIPDDLSLPTWDECARLLLVEYQQARRHKLAS